MDQSYSLHLSCHRIRCEWKFHLVLLWEVLLVLFADTVLLWLLSFWIVSWIFVVGFVSTAVVFVPPAVVVVVVVRLVVRLVVVTGSATLSETVASRSIATINKLLNVAAIAVFVFTCRLLMEMIGWSQFKKEQKRLHIIHVFSLVPIDDQNLGRWNFKQNLPKLN